MTPKEREVMQRALDAIGDCSPNKALVHAAYALREALAEQAEQERMPITEPVVPWISHKVVEQEPVAWMDENGWASIYKDELYTRPLYAAPVPTKDLTDDEIVQALGYDKSYRLKRWVLDDARAVIAADRRKNNANNNT